jgi:ATP-dependent Clp protease ATP-binding subunit ClpC
MFERFTGKARRTIVLAQEEARSLNHNFIGTEHILLGLLHEGQGIGPRALTQLGMTLEGAREEVTAIVSAGKKPPSSGHIPFTPRAKKTLELALREALQLHHNYIGTEHILLGLIREGDGVAVQVLRQHGDLLKIRAAVLDLVQTVTVEPRGRNWLRRVSAVLGKPGEAGEELGEETGQSVLSASPAADATLSAAAQLAGGEPVGSHHLLLAALSDVNSAAARVLASLGVDLTQAKDALHHADIAGTSDELPEDAGRRQMNLQVTDETVMIVATDETLVKSGHAALEALGPTATRGGVIRGADLAGLPAANLAKAWTAFQDALSAIATSPRPTTTNGEPKETAGAEVAQPDDAVEPGPDAAAE